jgi:hypothetical protein
MTKWAYMRFYMRPMLLLYSTLSVSSFTEFKRKFRALIDMIFRQEKRSEDWLAKKEIFKAYNENLPSRLRRALREITKFSGGR